MTDDRAHRKDDHRRRRSRDRIDHTNDDGHDRIVVECTAAMNFRRSNHPPMSNVDDIARVDTHTRVIAHIVSPRDPYPRVVVAMAYAAVASVSANASVSEIVTVRCDVRHHRRTNGSNVTADSASASVDDDDDARSSIVCRDQSASNRNGRGASHAEDAATMTAAEVGEESNRREKLKVSTASRR